MNMTSAARTSFVCRQSGGSATAGAVSFATTGWKRLEEPSASTMSCLASPLSRPRSNMAPATWFAIWKLRAFHRPPLERQGQRVPSCAQFDAKFQLARTDQRFRPSISADELGPAAELRRQAHPRRRVGRDGYGQSERAAEIPVPVG